MADRNLELALRIKADLDQSVKALRDVSKEISGIGGAAGRTSTALAKVNTDGVEKVAKVATSANQALDKTAESADAAADRYKRIAREAIAYREALDQQVTAAAAASRAEAEAAASTGVLASARERVKQADPYANAPQQMRSLDDLNQRLQAGAVSMEHLADTEQRLDRARKAGLITEEEYGEALTTLDKTEKTLQATRAKEEQQMRALLKAYDPAAAALRKLADDEAKLTKAVNEGRISREQYNRAMVGIAASRSQWQQVSEGVVQADRKMRGLSLTVREVRTNLASAASQLARGDITGAGNSLLTLGTRGVASLGLFGVALGGVVGTLGLYALALYKGYEQQQAFERALISSGNIMGATSGQLADVADRVGAANGRYGDAAKSVEALSRSGKIAVDALGAATSAAVSLSELTGESIESTTAKIIALAKAPSAQLAELNDQYHFLTLGVYEHVKSLEDQGRAEDAAREAIEAFARVHEQRVQDAISRAGDLERAWRAVQKSVLDAWQDIKNAGRQDAEFQRDRLSFQMSQLDADRRMFEEGGDTKRAEQIRQQILGLQDRYIALSKVVGKEQEGAKAASDAQKIQDEAIAARASIDKKIEDGYDRQTKKLKELNELQRKYVAIDVASGGTDPRLFDGSQDKLRAAIEDKYKPAKGPKPTKTDGEKADVAAARELANLKRQAELLGDLEEGEKKASEAARIRYEIEEGAYKNASPALQAQLKASAADLDNSRKQVEVAKELVDVKLRTMAIQGKGSEAELEKTIKALERLRVKAIEIRDLAGAADIAKLMNLERAKSQLGDLQRDLDVFYNRVSVAEQKVTIDRENGLISSVEAQRRLLAIRQQEIAYLQQTIPLLEQQNALLQDPRVAESLEQMKLKLYELQQQGTLLETTFRNTFEQGLGDALYNFATGAATAKEAVLGLVRDVTSGMARLAAQQLASMATAKIMSKLFGKGESADVGDGAAKLQAAAVVTGLAGGAVKYGANGLSEAAKELAAAATLMIVANSMGGFAEGGYTGPGGKYQLAGYVHKGEGVLNQQEINALGGPEGFYALRNAIAAGSLPLQDAGRAPALASAPRYTFADGGLATASLPTPQVNLRLVSALDVDELVQRLGESSAFERTIVHAVVRNRDTIQAGK